MKWLRLVQGMEAHSRQSKSILAIGRGQIHQTHRHQTIPGLPSRTLLKLTFRQRACVLLLLDSPFLLEQESTASPLASNEVQLHSKSTNTVSEFSKITFQSVMTRRTLMHFFQRQKHTRISVAPQTHGELLGRLDRSMHMDLECVYRLFIYLGIWEMTQPALTMCGSQLITLPTKAYKNQTQLHWENN